VSDDHPDTDRPHAVIETTVDHVATVRLDRPPNNFFSVAMIEAVAEALEALDVDDDVRVVLLTAAGKHFCAGADFTSSRSDSTEDLYRAAARLFRTRKPIVAAIQGAAIGGGLGVALAADFRVGVPEARMSANFARLGFHHGFALSVTLPRLVGQQRAAELFYTGQRVNGDEAATLGLLDRLVPLVDLEPAAREFAGEIAASAPLAVESIRATLRDGLADAVSAATERELAEQHRLRSTADFAEGVSAMAARRAPEFRRR
jgi:enoyl-CoA hydratase/carnithine racemase